MALGEGEGDAIRIPVEADVNAAQVTQQGGALGDALAKGIKTSGLSGAIDKSIEKNSKSQFDPTVVNAKRAAKSIGTAFDGAFSTVPRRFQEARKDLDALNLTAGALKNTMSKAGADPNLFAGFNRQVEKANEAIRELDDSIRRGAGDETVNKLAEHAAKAVKLSQQQLTAAQTSNKAFVANANKTAEAVIKADQQSATARQRATDQAHGKYIASFQREGAQVLAETRLAGQKQIQDERQRSRTRIELVRFTFQQIKILERGIAGVFRATGTIATSAFRTLGSAVDRIGGLFRRSNADLNEGLGGALRRRQSSIERSFSRQTTDIRRETLEQSRVIQRFETQASTGVAGALTGRSSLGALFGGGLALGGGFAAFQGLRNGIKVGGDFVQGLAVLGAQLELTDKQMAGVRQQSIDLGNDITLPGVSALDAAQAIQLLAKQFANLGDAALPAAQAAAKGVLSLSRAAGVQAEEAARVVGAAVNVFGVAADQAVAVADQITNALTKSAGVGFSEFADAFQQGASVFKLFVGPAESATDTLAEFNATLAVLAKGGIIGSTAGTGLKQFFLQANRGTKDALEITNQVITQAGETGSLFFDAEGNARKFSKTLDILRRGTEGLSDAARSTALQKLFGSRATTIANLLLNETAGQFDDLTSSILKQGSAADIAAAQNTGLRGALDALGSVIETQQIKTYERFQGVLGRVVLKFADLLNAFFEGRGIFGVIRAGLAGIGIALGSLLAVKVIAEGFQFLTIALAGLASPLGLVVGGFAALGAAVAVLRRVSPDFKLQTDGLADSIRQRLGGAAEAAGDLLGRLVRFVRSDVVPRFIDFANVAVRLVAPAIERVTDAAKVGLTTVKAFVDVLRGGEVTGRGGLVGFAETLATKLLALKEAVTITVNALVDGVPVALRRVETFARGAASRLEPAIGLFRDLGGAIRDALTVRSVKGGGRERDLDALIPDVGEILSRINVAKAAATVGGAAIGTAIGGPIGTAIGAAVGFGLGDKIIAAVRPQLERAVGFIGDFVSTRAGTVGGRLASSTQAFLLGPFQSAAVALGFFLGHLATNPKVVEGIAKIAALGALTAKNFLTGFLRGIIANIPGLVGRAVELVDDGFNGGLRKALAHPFDFAKVFALAFGGFKLFQLFRNAGTEGGKGFLAGLGSSVTGGVRTNRNFLLGFLGGEQGLQNQARVTADRAQTILRSELDRANRNLSRVGAATVAPSGLGPANILGGALVTQEDINLANKRLDQVKAKFGEVATAGLIARRQLTGGFRGLADFFNDFSRQFASKGQAIGVTLGVGIMSGVGAALAGQQLGGATSVGGAGIGLAGVIGAALIPALTIPGPVGLGLAGVTLAIGGLVALKTAFSDSGDASKLAGERLIVYTDILKQFNTVAEATPDLADRVVDALLDQGDAARAVLQRSGFNAAEFVDQAASGQATLADAVRDLTGGLGVDTRRIDDFLASEQRLGHSGQQAIDDLNRAARGRTSTTQATAFVAELRKGGTDAVAFTQLLQVLADQFGNLQRDIGKTDLRGDLLGAKDAAFQAAIPTGNLLDIVDKVAKRSSTRGQTIFFENLASNAELAQRRTDAVNQAIQSLNQQRTDLINARIADLSGQLDTARAAADAALQSVLDLVNTPFGDAFGQSIDDLLTGVDQIGASLQEQITAGLDIGALFNEVNPTGQGAAIRNIVDPFAQAFQSAVAQAVTDNPGISPDALRAKFQPVFDEIAKGKITIPNPDAEIGGEIQVNIPPAAQGILTDTLNSLLANQGLGAALDQVTVTNNAIADAQKQLDDANLELGVRVTFNAFQIQRALEALGLTVPLDSILAVVSGQQQAQALANRSPEEHRFNAQPVIVQGDVVAQKITEQNFQTADTAEVTAGAVARQARLAATGLGNTIAELTGGRLGRSS